jgi:hypothetical protein
MEKDKEKPGFAQFHLLLSGKEGYENDWIQKSLK